MTGFLIGECHDVTLVGLTAAKPWAGETILVVFRIKENPHKWKDKPAPHNKDAN